MSKRRAAVYIGAGTDTRPVRVLVDDIDDFVYVDHAPDGAGYIWGDVNAFVDGFAAKMRKNGWSPTSDLGAVKALPRQQQRQQQRRRFGGCFGHARAVRTRKMTFGNARGNTLTYYTHTQFPVVPIEVADAIAACDAIILSGYDPDGSLLQLVRPQPTIYAFDASVLRASTGHGTLGHLWSANAEIVFLRKRLPAYDALRGITVHDAQALMDADDDPYDDSV